MKFNNQQAKKPCGKRLAKMIRQHDIYGHQIGLTYNESTTYKTTIGGVFTFIARLGMLAYLVTEIIKVIDKTSTITVTQKIMNLAVDQTEIQLDQSKFDFAVRLKYALAYYEPTVEQNMHQYAQARAQGVEFGWKDVNGSKKENVIFTAFNFTKCGSGRFIGERESAEVIGIESNYQCINDFNFNLMGNWASANSKMLVFSIEKCSQSYLNIHYPGQKCKNSTEIDRVWENIQVLIAQTNQYFDQEDFSDNPIKTAVNVLFLTSHPVLGQAYNFKISENFAQVQDSWLSADIASREIPYYKMRLDTTYTKIADELYTKPITLNIMLDEDQILINRVVYTISDALSAVGGFFGIIVIIIQTLIGFLQENQFYQSLMNKMYIFQEDKQNVAQSMNQVGSIFNSNFSTTRFTDVQIDNKKETFNRLFDQICRRQSFKITLRQYLSGILCRGKNKQKLKIYQKGIHKVKREFEITNILLNMKKIQLITQIFLSKYQLALMPYFTTNLVTNSNSMDSNIGKDFIKKRLDCPEQEDKRKLMHSYLQQAFSNSKQSKVDNRLIKNLDIQYMREFSKTKSGKGLASLLNQHTNSLLIGGQDTNIHFQNQSDIKQSNKKSTFFERSMEDSDVKNQLAFDNKSEEIDIEKEIMDFDTQRQNY